LARFQILPAGGVGGGMRAKFFFDQIILKIIGFPQTTLLISKKE